MLFGQSKAVPYRKILPARGGTNEKLARKKIPCPYSASSWQRQQQHQQQQELCVTRAALISLRLPRFNEMCIDRRMAGCVHAATATATTAKKSTSQERRCKRGRGGITIKHLHAVHRNLFIWPLHCFHQKCNLERHMKLHKKTAKVQVRHPHEVNAVQAQNYNLFGTEENDKLWKQIPSLSLTCNAQEKTKHEKERRSCGKCSNTIYCSEPCRRRPKKYERQTDPSLTCRQCQKSFYLKCNLQRHMKLHQKTAKGQVPQPHEVNAIQAQNHNLFYIRK
ncbi:unnamed protein product [Trichogramma brassicae]|uniref:C2H2-type domain-containing protein n=1 Tax=Trichogramma brassicae TaxID=86971 RepID=A0A6H5I435_9HYME|nr:unnamed protein product [Trichogramma brassicae]